MVLLVRCEPTTLADIQAEGFAADFCIQLLLKISVIGVVVADGRVRLGWQRFAHGASRSSLSGISHRCGNWRALYPVSCSRRTQRVRATVTVLAHRGQERE